MASASAASSFCQELMVLRFCCALLGLGLLQLAMAQSSGGNPSCSGTLTGDTGILTSPNYPNNYDNDQNCVWTIRTKRDQQIRLVFTQIALETVTNCYNDYIQIFDGNSTTAFNLGRFCSSSWVYYDFVSTSNFLTVRFYTNSFTVSSGFSAVWTVGCFPLLTQKTGTFSSPGYPNYDGDEDCTYIIDPLRYQIQNVAAFDGSRSIKEFFVTMITFSSFNIPRSSDGSCGRDYIQVPNLPETFCGTQKPPPVETSSIRFVSGQSAASGYGFQANYSIDLQFKACGQSSWSNSTGNWTIPPNPVLLEGGCRWSITVKVGEIIWLMFQNSFYQYSTPCQVENLKIYDGPKTTDSLLKTFCGNLTKGMIESKTNILIIEYYTNRSNGIMRDSKLRYYAVGSSYRCNRELTGTNDQLRFPVLNLKVDFFYISCLWNITVDQDSVVQWKFDGPSIVSNSYNSYILWDVDFYDGNLSSNALISSFHQYIYYARKPALPMVRSSGNSLLLSLNFSYGYNLSDFGNFSSSYTAIKKNSVLRNCGGEFTGFDGNFKSPGFPGNYSNLQECLWIIRVHPDFIVQINFSPLSIESSDNCHRDSLQTFDGNNFYNSYQVCGAYPSYNTQSSSNITRVKFITDENNIQTGFNAFWKAGCAAKYNSYNYWNIYSPQYPGNYRNNLLCSYTIYNNAGPGYYIRYTFVTFNLEGGSSNGSCVNDYIKIEELNWYSNNMTFRSWQFCGTSLPAVLTTFFPNRITFVTNDAITGAGFNISFEFLKANCTNITWTSDESGTVNSPGYPGSFPHSYTCEWTIQVPKGKYVRLGFDHFNLGDNGLGIIEANACFQIRIGGTISLYDGGISSNLTSLNIHCGNVFPASRTTRTNILTIRFSGLSNSYYSTGFKATFKAVSERGGYDNCGGVLTGSGGEIKSPLYPQPYPNDSFCVWDLVGKVGDVIRISFDTLRLQDSDSCQLDYLEFRDGRSELDPFLDRVCGEVAPLDLSSSSNVMHIKFVTDNSQANKGFRITWVSVCENTYRTISGVVQSPSYPNSHNVSKVCIYHIEQAEGFVVQLQFDNFRLGAGVSSCETNYVEIRDGAFDSSRLIGKYCGNNRPPILTSTQNRMQIKFSTSGSASNLGFHAVFQRQAQTCGLKVLTDRQGTFTSPLYPSNYLNRLECTWKIQAPVGYVVVLAFNNFFLEGARRGSCSYDWITIRDGDLTLMGPYCGVNVPPTLTSISNIVTVVFFTDEDVTYRGFSASYYYYNPSEDPTQQYDLYPYGLESGDSVLEKKQDSTAEVSIKNGFPVEDKLVKKIYIANKGRVSFGKRDIGNSLDLKKGGNSICCLCANIGIKNSKGAVYYQLHTANQTILNKATKEIREFTDQKFFVASLVLIVTWDRVAHASSRNPEEKYATFQTALISNGRLSFSLTYYLKDKMKWDYMEGETIRIGYIFEKMQKPNEVLYSETVEAYRQLDKLLGNTGRKGMWIIPVGNAFNPEQECQDWYDRNLPFYEERKERFKRFPQCPCNYRFVFGNWLGTYFRHDNQIQCFRIALNAGRTLAPNGKECCYDWVLGRPTFGQYIADYPDTGSTTAFNPAYWELRGSYQQEDVDAHNACCYQAKSIKYCKNYYYKLRPSGECSVKIPYSFSWTFGDPHTESLDGKAYTFNGLGEFIMMYIRSPLLNFTLQGRTGLAETDGGNITRATVFKAFGLEENGLRMFIGLDPSTDNTLIIYAAEVDYTSRFQSEGAAFIVESDFFMLKRTNDGLDISLASGIQLTVSLGIKAVQISISMPTEYKGMCRGLLGNCNGNPDDDFMLPNGTILSNLSDRQIHQSFIPAYKVTEYNTVLRYNLREGPANYSFPDFMPIYLDEVPAATKQKAENFCGKNNPPCIYDFIATGSATVATATNKTSNAAKEMEKLANNTIPVLNFNSTVTVISGRPVTINLNGSDPDPGDSLTYHVIDDPTRHAVSLNNATGDVTFTVYSDSPVSLRFYAMDSKNIQSPVREVTLITCSGCSNHGSCDFTTTVASDSNPNFNTAYCICDNGWTGDDCEQDEDACAENPCSPQQICTDLTPSQQKNSSIGFICSACSQGYIVDPTDNTSCLDIDECSPATPFANNCSMGCQNLPGYFRCSCQNGFRLNADGRTCDDVNECADRTDGCQQTCNNTRGSFECGCHPGYTASISSGQVSCIMTPATQTACTGSGCEQGCMANNSGIANCFCFAGYLPHPNNSKTCMDRNECSEGACSQLCYNFVGSFACGCYPGYVLGSDQRTCTPCSSLRYGPDCRFTCDCNGRGKECNRVTGCVCESGWTGTSCELDIDECSEDPTSCMEEQLCLNKNGSYSCQCQDGYAKNAAGVCEDINECAGGSLLNTCGKLETCVNIPGSFYCKCLEGYARINGTCSDINECAKAGGNCQQICVNVPGSSNCECQYGFRLNSDRRTCTKVADVCAGNGLKCDHGCTLNNDNSAVCFCNTGFKLDSNQQSCSDINECIQGISGCSHNCSNTVGQFICSCPIGLRLDNDGRTCTACPKGTYGLNCSRNCSCGLGSARCDASAGCICQSGWTGGRCNLDVNECDQQTVQSACQSKNSICVNFPGGYKCTCPKGFVEDESDICQDIDECASSPCDQICENTLGSFHCQCNKGFSYINQQCQDINECQLPVYNKCTQHCDNIDGSYRCSCNVTGYVLSNDGFTCVSTTTCSRKDCPTENGGCSIDNRMEKCFCNSGYQLTNSSSSKLSCSYIDIDWCSQGSCQQICNETSDGRSFICSCKSGYILNDDGRTCRTCPEGAYGTGCSQSCVCSPHHSQSCSSVNGTCYCQAGWGGASCDDDVNECSSSPCPFHSNCTNLQGSYVCLCDSGYSKSSNGSCVDQNECDSQPCDQLCVNIPGSYYCSCNPGFFKNTTTGECQDKDECISSPCNQRCINTIGSYSCACNNGFIPNITTGLCQDVNECETQNDCLQVCTNTVGGHTCSCSAGYSGAGNNCQDINECTSITCDKGCENTPGSFICHCNDGFFFNSTSKRCQDIDECKSTHNCTQHCDNTAGSYKCACNVSGYVLGSDGVTCITKTSCSRTDCPKQHGGCSLSNGTLIENCFCNVGYELKNTTTGLQCSFIDVDWCSQDDCQQICNETADGQSFICSCTKGYLLNTDQKTCRDQNECEDSNPCDQTCVNTEGSFRCSCLKGYLLNSTTGRCQDVNECDNEPCDHYCVNTEGSYRCACIKGYMINETSGTCQDLNECLSSPCDQQCENVLGSFHCSCNKGFSLNSTTGKCQELRMVPMTFRVIIVIPVSEIADILSVTYLKWKKFSEESLTKALAKVSGFHSVQIKKLRSGSIIMESEILLNEQNATNSASSLAQTAADMSQKNLTVGNETGSVSVISNNTDTSDSCTIYESFNSCPDGQKCQIEGGMPSCRLVQTASSNNAENLGLIIGLSVSVPLVILAIAFGIICYCQQASKNKVKRHKQQKYLSDSDMFPNFQKAKKNQVLPHNVNSPLGY